MRRPHRFYVLCSVRLRLHHCRSAAMYQCKERRGSQLMLPGRNQPFQDHLLHRQSHQLYNLSLRLAPRTGGRVKYFRDIFGPAKASPMQAWPCARSNWRNAGTAEKGHNQKTGLTARGTGPHHDSFYVVRMGLGQPRRAKQPNDPALARRCSMLPGSLNPDQEKP